MVPVTFTLFGRKADGSVLELFRWCRDEASGLSRARVEAARLGIDLMEVWAVAACGPSSQHRASNLCASMSPTVASQPRSRASPVLAWRRSRDIALFLQNYSDVPWEVIGAFQDIGMAPTTAAPS